MMTEYEKSAFRPQAGETRGGRRFRNVPEPDSCAAANSSLGCGRASGAIDRSRRPKVFGGPQCGRAVDAVSGTVNVTV